MSGGVVVIQAFCMSGRHVTEQIIGTNLEDKVKVPHGWKLVRASMVDGKWVADENSGARIPCCPEHPLT
jgi:hypothetical protein